MKQVVKVSIAGCSFTLEQDACRMLDAYLNELKSHYGLAFGGEEIIGDIEERIAELIIERGLRDKVVSTESITEIIGILGYPDDIDGRGNNGSGSFGAEAPVRKRLFRDPDHKLLGGVCSGLAAYVNVDILLMRIIFVLFFLGFFGWMGFAWHLMGWKIGWFSLTVIIYLILWAVIPEAKTVAQRCAMRGETPGLGDIQKKFRRGMEQVSRNVDQMSGEVSEGMNRMGKDMGRAMRSGARNVKREGRGLLGAIGTVIVKLAGALLALTGIGGLITGCLLFMGLEVFDGISFLGLADYVKLDVSTSWIKILGLLVYFLPFIGILYAGIQLLFGFKSPKFRPGLIIFILWVVSLICLSIFAARAFRPYYNGYEATAADAPVKTYDTLYVKYWEPAGSEDARMFVEAGYSRFELTFINRREGKGGLEFITYPVLKVIRQSDSSDSSVECRMQAFSGRARWSESRKQAVMDRTVSVRDSLITIFPSVYTRQHKFDGRRESLRLYVPQNTVVMVTDPITHTFGESYYSNNNIFRGNDFFWYFRSF